MKIAWASTVGTLAIAMAWPFATAAAQGLEFKGAAFGASLPKVKKAVGKSNFLECYRNPKTKHERCNLVGLTYANEITRSVSMDLLNGALSQVIMTIDPASFDKIQSAITSKYGAPRRAAPQVLKNSFGATFDQVRLEWTGGDGWSIVAQKYRTGPDEGYVILRSAIQVAEDDRLIKGRPDPKSDL